MCAILTTEPAGKPPSVTPNVAVAAVMLPAESFVVFSVMFAVPVTGDSAFETGATSFAGDSAAVNTGFAAGVVVEGEVELLPQPAAIRLRASARTGRRFIWFSLEKFASEVEAEIQGLGIAAARDLGVSRRRRIGEGESEHVCAHAFLDRERILRVSGSVPAHARRALADNVDGWPDLEPRAEADERRVLIGSGQRVVDEERARIQRDEVADCSRDDDADRRRVSRLKVVAAFDAGDCGDAERDRRGLMERVELARQLNIPVDVGPRGDRFDVLQDAETVLELNRCALVQPEEIAQLRREVVIAQVFVEPMRQVEVPRMQ